MNWREIVLVIALVGAVGMYAHEIDTRDRFIVDHVIGAKALCNDGMYSTSKKDNGACSRHGGVKRWIIHRGK